jgi:hypothetical protein
MSLPIYQRVAVTDAGDVIPGAEYTVINENTGVAAPIYSDRTGATLLTAPYFADSVGTIQFFIAQGTTFRVAASGGVGTYTDRYVYGVAEAVLVQADGNVGIGTSSPSGLAKTLNIDGGAGGSSIAIDGGNNFAVTFVGATVGDPTSMYSNTGFKFATATAKDATGFSEKVRISSSGNVGIGNSDPTVPLDVRKAAGGNFIANFQNTTASTPYGVSIKDAVGGSSGYPLFQVTNSAGSTAHLKVMSGTGDVLAAGNLIVGGGGAAIGSSSTIYQAGDSRNVTTFVSSAPTQPYGLQVRYTVANPNSTVNGFFEAYAWNGSSYLQKFVVRSNGGIANFQANDVNLSDEREKKNITDLGSTWNCLKEWEVIEYHYNFDTDDSDKKYGVIAQQVEAHCPEVISDFKTQERIDEVLWVDDGDLPEGVSVGDVKTAAQDEVVRKGVKEQQMMWMAIKALQEAQARIESLEAVAQSLAARIEALEGK